MTDQSDLKDAHILLCGVGYLGEKIARQALERGMRVTGITRSPERAQRLKTLGLEMVEADLVEQDWYQKVPQSVDFVLNSISAGGGGVNDYIRAYVESMHSLLHWCAGGFSGRLIYTSSTGVYPFCNGEEVTESMSFTPETEKAEILLSAEQLLRNCGPEHSTILRLAGIYGPGRHYLLNQVLSGESEIPGEGDVYLNLIRVEDICRAVWKLWESDASVCNTVYNIADNEPTLKREVVTWLAEKAGKPVPEFNPSLSRRQRHLPNGKLPHRKISNRKLKNATGWEPEFPSFREGLADLIESGLQ